MNNILEHLSHAAAYVKLVCGVANNTAWYVVMDGYDHARCCHNYHHRVKSLFRQAIKEWHDYEHRLIFAKENRMFHVADLREDVRRRYNADITDKQYYELWASVGGPAYQKSKPLITSLWNKHRLSLIRHKVDEADHVAWVVTAMAAIELADQLYAKAIEECVNGYKIPRPIAERVFGQFCLSRLKRAWRQALMALAPGCEFELEPVERKNIELGLTQLCEAWLDPSLLYDSTLQSVEDYDEVFRTRGFQKKVMREIADVKNETLEALQNEQST